MNLKAIVVLVLSILLIIVVPAYADGGTEDALVITWPIDGSVVTAGEKITVIVESAESAAITRVLLSGQGVALVDDSAPFKFEVVIPLETSGSLSLSATGKNDNNDFAFSAPITLQVNASVFLSSMSVSQELLKFSQIGQSQPIGVTGNFNDGSVRDIASSDDGTTFASMNNNIVQVTRNGVVTAIGNGSTTIIIRNGSHQQVVDVIVEDYEKDNDEDIVKTGTDTRIFMPMVLH